MLLNPAHTVRNIYYRNPFNFRAFCWQKKGCALHIQRRLALLTFMELVPGDENI